MISGYISRYAGRSPVYIYWTATSISGYVSRYHIHIHLGWTQACYRAFEPPVVLKGRVLKGRELVGGCVRASAVCMYVRASKTIRQKYGPVENYLGGDVTVI